MIVLQWFFFNSKVCLSISIKIFSSNVKAAGGETDTSIHISVPVPPLVISKISLLVQRAITRGSEQQKVKM